MLLTFPAPTLPITPISLPLGIFRVKEFNVGSLIISFDQLANMFVKFTTLSLLFKGI